MRVQRMLVPLSLALMGLSGCNVYDRWDGGEFNAGPVDASNFPPEYLGTGANRQRAGTGSFTARKANALSSDPREYFLFTFSAGQRAAKDPLAVRSNGNAVSAVPTPSAYVFDACSAPEGYSFDADRDAVPYDRQGAIFTKLPTATYNAGAVPTTTYVPVIQKVAVTGQDVACQKLKSEKSVVASKEIQVSLTEPLNGKQFGIPDSTFHAYAVIEPGAAVYRPTETSANATGVGLQSWGWFNQYQLAYLDGGQIPTTEVKVNDTTTVVRMVPQKLYVPRSQVTVGTANKAVTVGQGYDVLAAKRGEPGYSPVCEVLTYDAGAALTPAQLPKTESEVLELVAMTGKPLAAPVKAATDVSPANDPYVYCLQLQ